MRHLYLFLFILFAARCSTKQADPQVAGLETFLETIGIDSKKRSEARYIIVIPNAGCSGCILNSEAFMFNSIDKLDSTYFILTSFNSLKSLRVKYNAVRDGILAHKRIVIDHNNEFANVPIDQIYPVIIYLKDGTVIHQEVLDVENTSLLNKIGPKK